MADTHCKSCSFFYVNFGDRLGVCRRFPVYQNRSETEWCGEFKGKMIALPVVEMQQEIEVKRKGRPPKKEQTND